MRSISGAALTFALILAPTSAGAAAAKELPVDETQVCGLLSREEAGALIGGKPDVTDAEAPPGTLYCGWALDDGYTLGTRLSITLIDGPALGGLSPAAYFQAARRTGAGNTDLSGAGDAAFTAEPQGLPRAVILAGDWIAIVSGPGASREAVAAAARTAGGRLRTVQHPLAHDKLPDSCALIGIAEAGLVLGQLPYVMVGDTPESRGACMWSYGGRANLLVVTREGAALAGQSAADFFKEARASESISRPVDDVDAGDRAFITPANPRGQYFYLMVLQNGRIAILSGLGIERDEAETAAQAVASRM